MNFTPMNEEDLPSGNFLIPKDEYYFEIVEATDKISAKGNEMIELRCAIWKGEKVVTYLFDYLLDAIPAKLRHCCNSIGILDKYQSGNLSAFDFTNKAGWAKVDIQKDTTGKYEDKNIIKDYVVRTENKIKPQQPDDDLPF